MNAYTSFDELKEMHPDEWLLLGNPQIEDALVLGGIVLYHSKDKKEVCYIGRDKTSGYSSITLAYTGDLKKRRTSGILRRIRKSSGFLFPVEEGFIIVEASIEDIYKLRLALDTAATHTTIDSNVLFLLGYELKESKGEQELETSNGIILVELYDFKLFECLGTVKPTFEIQVYDFLSHGITSDYDGVVGLNFLREHKFCIDIAKGEITVDR